MAQWLPALIVGVAHAAVSLTHDTWSFDSRTEVLAVGVTAWSNKADVFAALPAALVGAVFWPGLGHALCPPGTLRLTAPSDGVAFAWHDDFVDFGASFDGKLYTLDDDPASGWVILDSGSLSWSPLARSAVIYARPVVGGTPVEITIGSKWAGGVAFSDSASIQVKAMKFALSWSDLTDYDNAPRKLEVGRRVVRKHWKYGSWAQWGSVWSSNPGTSELELDSKFEGAYYWPGIDHVRPAGTASAWFETSSAGTLFAMRVATYSSTNMLDVQYWEFLGQVKPMACEVYAKLVAAGSRVELPRQASGHFELVVAFREGWNIFSTLNTTADVLAGGQGQAVAVLTHPHQRYGMPPRAIVWEVGAQVWAEDL